MLRVLHIGKVTDNQTLPLTAVRVFYQIFHPAAQDISGGQQGLEEYLVDALGFQFVLLQCFQVYARLFRQFPLRVSVPFSLLLQLGKCVFPPDDGVRGINKPLFCCFMQGAIQLSDHQHGNLVVKEHPVAHNIVSAKTCSCWG